MAVSWNTYIHSLLCLYTYTDYLAKKFPIKGICIEIIKPHTVEWRANNPAVSRVCINKEFSSGSFLLYDRIMDKIEVVSF